jgi:hypothetical protein
VGATESATEKIGLPEMFVSEGVSQAYLEVLFQFRCFLLCSDPYDGDYRTAGPDIRRGTARTITPVTTWLTTDLGAERPHQAPPAVS